MRKRKLAPVVILVMLATACLHKSGGTPVTPWEKVHSYSAALADANNSLEQGAEAVVNAGVLRAEQAAPIIGWTGKVAAVHQQITAVLEQGSVTQANLDSIEALVDQIKEAGNDLPLSAIGIKNPKSQQTFQADFNNIYALADAILSSLKAIKQ